MHFSRRYTISSLLIDSPSSNSQTHSLTPVFYTSTATSLLTAQTQQLHVTSQLQHRHSFTSFTANKSTKNRKTCIKKITANTKADGKRQQNSGNARDTVKRLHEKYKKSRETDTRMGERETQVCDKGGKGKVTGDRGVQGEG